MKPADRVEQAPPSGIRRFFELAAEMDDVISLGVGEPDFATPWAARDAAITSLERGQTSYTMNRGRSDLREAVAERMVDRYDLRYDPETEVLVTAGASEGIDLAFRALVDPGDTVAVVQPSYVSYVPGVLFAGGEVLPVPTRQEESFKLSYDLLEKHGAAAADFLVYCYPNNPTGATLGADDAAEVAAFARENDLTVLADEVYAIKSHEPVVISADRTQGFFWTGFDTPYQYQEMQGFYVTNQEFSLLFDRYISHSLIPRASDIDRAPGPRSLPARYVRIQDCITDLEQRNSTDLTVSIDGFRTTTRERVQLEGRLVDYYSGEDIVTYLRVIPSDDTTGETVRIGGWKATILDDYEARFITLSD